MTPLHRWKLISLVLAGCVSYSWWHGEATSSTVAAPAHARYKGALRISAAALGISTDELIRELFAAKTYEEMKPLAQRLGMVGDDAAIEAVRPLVDDPRDGVPGLVIEAFGTIATDHAVDVLIELARDPRDEIRGAAAEALGATRSARGEPILIEIAERPDEARESAMRGLAELASSRAIEVLARLAGHTDDSAAAAVRALATIDKPAARAALVQLVDAPSVTVAATAIGQLAERDLDPDLIAKLTAIVHGGDRTLIAPALAALAKAGEAGLPVLREAALRGPLDLRAVAMGHLAELDEGAAIETLRTIVENEPGRAADAAANVLADIDSDDARDALISAALADEANGRIVQYLLRQRGSDVEQALLVIAKSDSGERWQAVEHLVRGGNADALDVAVEQARSGDAEARLAAMQALAGAGTAEATEALVGLVEHGGDVKARALDIVAAARPDDPRVGKLLADAVRSNDPELAGAAASALAKIGTSEARDTLIGALGSQDSGVVANAAASLASFRITDDMTAALRSAIAAHPDLEPQVMAQLVGAGSSLGIELAKKALAGDSPDAASRAIASLQQAGTPAALDTLVEGTRVGDAQVRAQAIAALGNAGDARAPELVAQATRDSDATVRVSAARALGQLATPKARDLLIQMTRSADDGDRRAAVASLGGFEGAETTRRLADLMRDPSFGVAYAALDALSERKDGVPALRGLMTDTASSSYLRYQAARMLSYRGISDPAIDRALNEGYGDE